MTSSVVVDASVAVKWFILEERSAEAVALTGGTSLVAPTLIGLEVASALSKKARRNLIAPDLASRYLAALPRYFVELVDHDALLPAALALSVELGHPIYDCVYLEAARRRQVRVVTDDLAFLTKVGRSDFGRYVVALEMWTTALR